MKQSKKARSALDKGRELEQTKLAKLASGDLGGSWIDWIIAKALLREAEGLIDASLQAKAVTK